jgi:hypothetical protein
LLVPLLAVVVAMVVAPDVVTSNFNCVCECSTMKSTAMGVGALYLCGVKSLSDDAGVATCLFEVNCTDASGMATVTFNPFNQIR